jgi:hypothetical protein
MDILNEAMAIASDKSFANDLITSRNYPKMDNSRAQDMSVLLANTQRDLRSLLNENTMTADVAQFTPIIMPMVRRIYPNLIANELLGIQPMSMPTGFIYALVNQYLGDGDTKVGDRYQPAGVIYEFEYSATGYADITVGLTAGDGAVLYVEGNKALCSFTSTKLAVGSTLGTGNHKIVGVYTNEAAFGKILKNYTGPYTTATAETLGIDMKEIGFSIDRKNVVAQSRALKGRYTVEMYQDLKSQHQLNADEELMSIMQYEIQAELDREIVDFVNTNATQLPDTNFGVPASSAAIIIPDGRWEIERYRANAVRIAKEAALIGIETKRGQGNVLVVSPLVATMLEQVGSFQTAPVGSTINAPVSGGVAGVFDNRYKVVIDQYATSDYCTVLYKGDNRRDAMGFYAPYVPLQFTRVTNAESGQPAIIAKVRYALTTIPGIESAESNDRAKTYARSFGVSFENTILAH